MILDGGVGKSAAENGAGIGGGSTLRAARRALEMAFVMTVEGRTEASATSKRTLSEVRKRVRGGLSGGGYAASQRGKRGTPGGALRKRFSVMVGAWLFVDGGRRSTGVVVGGNAEGRMNGSGKR